MTPLIAESYLEQSRSRVCLIFAAKSEIALQFSPDKSEVSPDKSEASTGRSEACPGESEASLSTGLSHASAPQALSVEHSTASFVA